MGISISIAADTSQFTKAIAKGVVDPLGDAETALGEVARDGENAGDKLERSFDQARKSLTKLNSEQDQTQRGFKKTGDDASETMQTVSQEAKQNLSETFSSFDGSVTGMLDGIQGTFGGIISDLGPLGIVAGAAGAAGIGLISQAFDQSQAQSEAFKQQVADLAQQLIDTGGIGGPAVQAIADKLKQLATTTDSSVNSLTKIRKQAGNTVSSYSDLAQAIAGYGGNLDELIAKEQDQADALKVHAHNTFDLNMDLENQAEAQQHIVDELKQTKIANDQATEAQQAYVAAGGPQLKQKAALIESINNAYDDAAGSVDNYVDSETGVFNVQAYIDAMNAKLSALGEYQTLLANSTLSQSAKTYLSSLGADAAAQLMQAYKSSTDSQRANLDRIWGEAGKSNSGQYVKNVITTIPDRIDKQPTVVLRSDTAQAQNEINRFIDRTENRTMRITATVVDRAGRPIL